jgi:pimeloyl-ACP methyl ester carboxylesterase
MEWGPREAAQTVVCVHGLSRNGRDFDVLAERLAAQGVRVAAPDLPGRGASGWLTDPDDYALPLYLGAMTTLLARLNASSVDWVGTSLGGFIGMHIAADPRSPIRRLVLNDFGAKVSAAALHRIGSYVGSAPTFADRTEAEVYFRRIHAPFGALSDAHWQHIVQHSVVEMPNGRLRLHYDPRIGKQFDWPFMLDLNLWHVWEKVTAPVLLLRGAQSDLFPARVAIDMTRRGAAAQAGRVQLVEFPDCGHAPSLMAPDHIAPVLRFLAAQDVHDRANASAEDIDVRGNVLAPKSRVA